MVCGAQFSSMAVGLTVLANDPVLPVLDPPWDYNALIAACVGPKPVQTTFSSRLISPLGRQFTILSFPGLSPNMSEDPSATGTSSLELQIAALTQTVQSNQESIGNATRSNAIKAARGLLSALVPPPETVIQDVALVCWRDACIQFQS